jgi:hypothetical protein
MKTKLCIIIGFLSVSLLLFSSCFHKNIATCNADNILKVIIYSDNATNYLISYESVFQVRSKSSGNGMTTISGINDMRISVYDLSSGELIIREKTNRNVSGEFLSILGVTNNQIWIYSEEDGLHSLNLFTLETEISQEDIISKNQDFADKFAKPAQYYEIGNSYGFDEIHKRLLLSDNEGFKYYLNISTLEIDKIGTDIEISNSFGDNYLGSSGNLDNYSLYFEGDIRKNISLNSTIFNHEISFLDGEFILDKNPNRINQYIKKKHERYRKQSTIIQFEIDSMPEINGKSFYDFDRDVYNKQRSLEKKLDSLDHEYRNIQSDYNDLIAGKYHFINDLILQPDSASIFVVHKSSTDKDAKLRISRLKFENNKLLEEWNIQLDDIYYDYNEALETNDFEEVFSKGNPDFSFEYYEVIDEKLIAISMLHLYCIDVKTGEVFWSVQL